MARPSTTLAARQRIAIRRSGVAWVVKAPYCDRNLTGAPRRTISALGVDSCIGTPPPARPRAKAWNRFLVIPSGDEPQFTVNQTGWPGDWPRDQSVTNPAACGQSP